jgi:hypothetical protein
MIAHVHSIDLATLRGRYRAAMLMGTAAVVSAAGCGSPATPAPSATAAAASPALSPGAAAPTPVPAPDDRRVQVLSAGIGSFEETVIPIAVIKNHSTQAATGVAVHFRVVTPGGGLFMEVTDTTPIIGAGQTTVASARLEGQDIGGGATAVAEVGAWSTRSPAEITASPGVFGCGRCGPRSGYGEVTTTLTTSAAFPPSPIHVAVACTDAAGKIVGGGSRLVPWTAEALTQAASVPVLVNSTPAACGVGATPAS